MMNESTFGLEADIIEARVESFHESVNYVKTNAGHLDGLIDKTEQIIDMVDWGLLFGPDYLDRELMPFVSNGITDGITAVLEVGMNAEQLNWDMAFASQESICDWRIGFTTTARRWLFGWTNPSSENRSIWRLFVDEFRMSFRLVGFVLRLLWLLYFASFRLDCSPMEEEEEEMLEETEEETTPETMAIMPWEDTFEPEEETYEEEEEDTYEAEDEIAAIPLPGAVAEDIDETETETPTDTAFTQQELCDSLYEEFATLVGLQRGVQCPDEQVTAAKARLEVEAWDADCRWDLAICYAQAGAHPLAVKEYEDVLHQRPEYHDARKQWSYCLAELKQWNEAVSQIQYLASFPLLKEEAEDILDLIETIRADCEELEDY